MQILMLYPLRYVAAMPFAVESVWGFAERGYKVDVLVSKSADPAFHCNHANVRTYMFFDRARSRGGWYWGFLRKASGLAKATHYDLTIGLSPMGLIAAAMLKKRFGIPCVFFNDEICFGNERHGVVGSAFGCMIKALERRANHHVMFTVTQDPERGRLLAAVNRVPLESLRYLPNSRSGSAKISTSNYISERFSFPRGTKVILWLGVAAPGQGGLQLARETSGWPEDYRLVFHFRTDRPTTYMQRIIECHGKGRTYVSRNTIPYAELDALVSSTSIGLGIYDDLGPNTRCMGAASGKINSYLKAGVPCIVSDYEGLRWVEEAGAGICVKDVSHVVDAAQRIMADYSAYQNRAIRVFEERLSFDRSFSVIANEIDEYLH